VASKNIWLDTMLGCLAVWAITLVGLICLVNMKLWAMIAPYAMMFSSGTLLTTAFALVLYESTHLITDQSSTESLAAGRWCAMVLVGFLSSPVASMILMLIIPKYMAAYMKVENRKECDVEATVEMTEVVSIPNENIEKSVDDSVKNMPVEGNDDVEKFSILFSMMLGDFFHNFSDGIFIGSGFQCNAAFAWKIVGVTVLHELSQELSDFFILTQKLNYSTLWALTYNVLCGMSVMFGGIVITALNVQSKDVGMILAYGAGNYVYAATVHLFEREHKCITDDVIKLSWFCVGCVAIGLILLDHQHCESSVEDGHGSHGAH
jgi:UTP--glucose-1-phosphate uridylyltransferase